MERPGLYTQRMTKVFSHNNVSPCLNDYIEIYSAVDFEYD